MVFSSDYRFYLWGNSPDVQVFRLVVARLPPLGLEPRRFSWSSHNRLCSLYFILGVQEESKLPLALALLGLDKSISFALRCRLTILPGDNTLGLFLWLKA